MVDNQIKECEGCSVFSSMMIWTERELQHPPTPIKEWTESCTTPPDPIKEWTESCNTPRPNQGMDRELQHPPTQSRNGKYEV